MPTQGKKLGILIASSPEQPGFLHGLGLAEAALQAGTTVYLYCIDDAVRGVTHPRLQSLRASGAHLFACAYAAQHRHLPPNDAAVFSGLSIVTELIADTDRFVSFN